ncbi:hypothetical protein [Mycobacterium sp. E2479]|uniref:hypothetical protein n=1 Tax=Mycobacterium sp. E2479 TaxID=1834134 RepID=UPI0008021385|nr:hypothetical protein [Mycobacterium sp. E2479]OBH51079.1 hypothetical protein A5686_12515 [Mycobacterium sp. E2479]
MDVKENVRRAIEVMTAWSSESDPDFAWSRLVENVGEPHGELMLLMGFVNLAGELGIRLERATGQDLRSHLRDIARKYV